jgi:hypothetical protein
MGTSHGVSEWSGPEPLKPVIDEWLLEDMKRARKYRRTATKF